MISQKKNILSKILSVVWQGDYTGDRWVKYGIRFLTIILILSLFHKFIANDVPILARSNQGISSPVISDYYQGIKGNRNAQFLRQIDYQWAIYPPIPYRDKTMDKINTGSVSPFDDQNISSLRYRHWLGTDQLGRDVFAGLIYGLATAMKVGFYSGIISLIIGLFLGGIAGFFGDHSLKWNALGISMTIVLFLLYWYLCRYYVFTKSILFTILLLLVFVLILGFLLKWSQNLNIKDFKIPLDLMIVRFMEVFKSIPVLIFLIAILGLIKSASIWNVIILIGIIRWPSIARYVRAEMLAVKKENYIQSARALGANNWRILVKHALPNIISPILVSVAFGFAVAILLEASLSFLGIGIPLDEVTLGSLLSEARKDFSAWWLALFPGLIIFILLACFNMLGQRIEEYYNPKLMGSNR